MLQLFNNNRNLGKTYYMIKPFRHCTIQDSKKLKKKPSLGKFGADFQRQSFTVSFLNRCSKNFAILEPFLIKMQAFFYRTPTVAAFGFLRQQIPFSAKSGMHWRYSHRFLSRIPLKIQVKPQKQPLLLFYKKRCSQKFCKFHRKTSVLKSLFSRVAGQETQIQMISCRVMKLLKTDVNEQLLLKPVVSPGVSSNQYKLVYSFCITIYSFACQFSLHY